VSGLLHSVTKHRGRADANSFTINAGARIMSIPDQTKHSARQPNGTQASTSQEPQIVTEVLKAPGPNSPDEAPQIAPSQATALRGRASRDAATLRNALAFTQVVGVLMRSPHYRRYTLADLEWLVIPPLLAGQFRIGEAKVDKNQGAVMPVAVVLWASVSAEVDKKLMETEEASLQLKPEEWKSGDILWLVHAAGETRFVRQVVDELTKTTLKGRQVKVRAHDPAGKSKIHVLGASAQA
jgi:cytolysin-activating lysine-acyltransferase